ncbi:flagellar basal body P-ring formation chaperone FlgA [uncultured Lentibacter sp.]|uniref:flagellar basal body P-ring formation chaperone FlgA n=1 Tax=uncultured Lentibacter sp. TaxID=1659309 RepID=UPI00261B75AA|nr:flagellar basal body P-ring formation chaperone FlgA [uncultured Lentibacter sp.]
MRRLTFLITLLMFASSAHADVVIAMHTIRPKTILSESDLGLRPAQVPGAIQNLEDAIGMETRVSLYAGRPIRAADLRPAAVIDRNQIVTLSYQHGSLTIRTEARALGRAAPGETIKAMNLSSKTTVHALVLPDGTLAVKP